MIVAGVGGAGGSEGAEGDMAASPLGPGRTVRAWHLVGLGSIAAAVLMAIAPQLYRAVAVTVPDSTSYLSWMVGRTPAYPLLLRGLGVFSPSLALLGPVQFGMLAVATCWFTHVVERFSQSRIASAALGLAIILHPQVVSYTQTVLPESLFLSVLLFWLGSIIQTLDDPQPARVLRAGILVGFLILIKPAAYGFVPATVVLALLLPARTRLRAATILALGIGMMLLIGALLTFARTRVSAAPSFAGYALIGITGTFVDPEHVPAHTDLVAKASAQLGPLRGGLERTPSLEVHHFLSAIAYHTVHSAWIALIERHLLEREAVAPGSDEGFGRLNAIAMEISTKAIAHHPGAYARHVLAQLKALWLVPFVRSAAEAAAVDREIDALAKETPGGWQERPSYRVVPAPLSYLFRAGMWVALIVSLVSMLSVAWRERATRLCGSAVQWRVLVVASTTINGYFLLVALAQPGLPRYALMMWPAIVLLLTVAGTCVAPTPLLRHRQPTQP